MIVVLQKLTKDHVNKVTTQHHAPNCVGEIDVKLTDATSRSAM